jgi:hypothetical protein
VVLALVVSLMIWGLPAFAAEDNGAGEQPPGGTDAAGVCGARPPADPAPWEETLPIADVSDELAADDPGCVREIDRTANAVVWAGPEGGLTARQYADDVNYQTADGTWDAIDTRLVPDGQGGTVNKAGPFAVRFAGRADADQLVHLDAGGASLSLAFEGAARTDAMDLVAPNAAEGEVDGSPDADTITYPDVLDGVDLEYQVLSSTVKEAFVLDGPLPAGVAPRFAFSLALDGFDARTAEDGTIEFVDTTTGDVAFWIPQGFALDSSGNPEEGIDPAITPVTTTLTEGDDGGHRGLGVELGVGSVEPVRDPPRRPGLEVREPGRARVGGRAVLPDVDLRRGTESLTPPDRRRVRGQLRQRPHADVVGAGRRRRHAESPRRVPSVERGPDHPAPERHRERGEVRRALDVDDRESERRALLVAHPGLGRAGRQRVHPLATARR